jgi:phage terminase Nu1 subunit (DNA packaging protein)
MAITLTKKELATVAGYSYRRLHDIDIALPQGQKLFVESEGGKYDLATFVQRWVDYKMNSGDAEEKSLDEVKAQHELVKIQKSEIELSLMKGELVEVGEIRKLWGVVATTVTQNVLHLPSKIAPMVLGLTNAEIIASIIDREVREVLSSIADTPLPSHITGDAESDESEDADGE